MVHPSKKVILSIRPDKYLSQGISNCGLFSIKGILSAYGLDEKADPREYHTNLICRLTSISWGENYYKNILASYSVDSDLGFAENISDEKKLDLLKKLLSNNTPVMIRIGNGYFTSDKYNSIVGRLLPHWITLWGFDDEPRVFYVYDSGSPRSRWAKSVPIGNTTRTFDEILRDWRFGKKQPWSWTVTGPHNFAYINIKGRKND
jgi:hypothetical protein